MFIQLTAFFIYSVLMEGIATLDDGLDGHHTLSCGNLVSTGKVILFMKESFPLCSAWG
jgi:hypothetical protein